MSTLVDTDDIAMEEFDAAMSKAPVSTRPFDSCQRSDPDRLPRIFKSQRELGLCLLKTDLPYYHTPTSMPSRASSEEQHTDPSHQRLQYSKLSKDEKDNKYHACEHTPVSKLYKTLRDFDSSVVREKSGKGSDNPVLSNEKQKQHFLFSRYERDYFQKGLQSLTRCLQPRVSLSGKTDLLSQTEIQFQRTCIPHEGELLVRYCYYSRDWIYITEGTTDSKWFPPDWGWDLHNTLECTKGRRTELNHLIWSTYSWCCKDTQQPTVSEAQLLSWMEEQSGRLMAQCSELREMLQTMEKMFHKSGEYRFIMRSETWVEGSELKCDVWPGQQLEQFEDFESATTTPTTVSDSDVFDEEPQGRSEQREQSDESAA